MTSFPISPEQSLAVSAQLILASMNDHEEDFTRNFPSTSEDVEMVFLATLGLASSMAASLAEADPEHSASQHVGVCLIRCLNDYLAYSREDAESE